jgi:hypothetical protein
MFCGRTMLCFFKIVLLKVLRWPRAANTFLDNRMLASPGVTDHRYFSTNAAPTWYPLFNHLCLCICDIWFKVFRPVQVSFYFWLIIQYLYFPVS